VNIKQKFPLRDRKSCLASACSRPAKAIFGLATFRPPQCGDNTSTPTTIVVAGFSQKGNRRSNILSRTAWSYIKSCHVFNIMCMIYSEQYFHILADAYILSLFFLNFLILSFTLRAASQPCFVLRGGREEPQGGLGGNKTFSGILQEKTIFYSRYPINFNQILSYPPFRI
jgi:hypothetical protein